MTRELEGDLDAHRPAEKDRLFYIESVEDGETVLGVDLEVETDVTALYGATALGGESRRVEAAVVPGHDAMGRLEVADEMGPGDAVATESVDEDEGPGDSAARAMVERDDALPVGSFDAFAGKAERSVRAS